jgi:hypothetical protein
LCEAGLHVPQRLERPDHETRRHQQDERERDLHDDEPVAGPMAFAAVRRCPCAAKRRYNLRSPVLQNGNQAKQQSREQRCRHSEPEHDRIDGDFLEPWQRLRCDCLEQLQGEECHSEAERAADEAEHQALMQQFARDAPPARPERGPSGELLLAALDPHEQQVRNVGARNEQDDPDRAHEHPEHIADVADHALLQRLERRRDARTLEHAAIEPERRRPRLEPDRHQAADVGIGLLERHPWFEPRQSLKAEVTQDDARTIEPLRQDYVDVGVEEAEARGHDADDGAGDRVDGHRSSDNRGITAEPPLPVSVHEDDGFRRSRRVVFAGEPSPQRRRDAECLKDAVCDAQVANLLWFGKSRDRDAAARPQPELLERSPLLPVREEHRRRHVEVAVVEADPGCRVPDADQLVRARIRQRLEEHAVDDAEDGRVGANADRQSHQSDDGEHRRAHETTEYGWHRHMLLTYENVRARFRLTGVGRWRFTGR